MVALHRAGGSWGPGMAAGIVGDGERVFQPWAMLGACMQLGWGTGVQPGGGQSLSSAWGE